LRFHDVKSVISGFIGSFRGVSTRPIGHRGRIGPRGQRDGWNKTRAQLPLAPRQCQHSQPRTAALLGTAGQWGFNVIKVILRGFLRISDFRFQSRTRDGKAAPSPRRETLFPLIDKMGALDRLRVWWMLFHGVKSDITGIFGEFSLGDHASDGELTDTDPVDCGAAGDKTRAAAGLRHSRGPKLVRWANKCGARGVRGPPPNAARAAGVVAARPRPPSLAGQ